MPNNTFYYTISAKTNEDISWYIGQENVSEYTLETTAQLFGFAALVNGTAKRADGTLVNSVNFSGKTIYLANDVDVSGYEWIAIGYSDGYTPTAFAGTFDGNADTGYHRPKLCGFLRLCYRYGEEPDRGWQRES